MEDVEQSNSVALLSDSIKSIVSYMPEHHEMISKIQESLPEIQRASSMFFKTQSQFMDNMLTVSHPTPIRNLRQILAEMRKARDALKEAHFGNKKKEIQARILERSLAEETDYLKKELIEVEMLELYSQIESAKGYISGAIRKLANYTEQYNSILASMNKKDFNEVDFEAEEERYHVMKAFEQALCSARSRGGSIDEGNHIYLCQIGVNGASAQTDITRHLIEEGAMIKNGKSPDHTMVLTFLNEMGDKYKGCSRKYAEHKGMTGKTTEYAALKTGDTRLIGNVD